MTTTIDQKKYLKKYLSSAKSFKKRTKVKKKDVRVKIIDDDLDMATFNEAVTEDLTGLEIEDAPQIVGVTDDRPLEMRVNDYKTDMWKTVTILDSDEESEEVKSKRKRNEQDFSPIRVKIEAPDCDNSPSRNNSPPRRTQKTYSSDDNSPPRKSNNRNNEDSTCKNDEDDNSPPRHRRKRNNEDNSSQKSDTTRRNDKNDSPSINRVKKPTKADRSSKTRVSRWNNDLESDNNLPCKAQKSRGDKDNTPPRKGNKIGKDEDMNPPRTEKLTKSESDNTSTGKNHNNRDRERSSPRKHRSEQKYNSAKKDREKHKKSEDNKRDDKSNHHHQSTSKRRDDVESSLRDKDNPSTSKLRHNERDSSSTTNRNDSREQSTSSSRTSDPSSYYEKDKLERPEINLNLSKKETPGSDNNATKTIVRDRKTGRIRNLQEEAAASREKEKEKNAIREKYSRWGKGLKQVDDANEKLAHDLHTMQKPLARYANDEDLEDMLKNREREGDPMLEYLRKKKREKAKSDPNAKPEKPKYQGDFGPPNRYGIKPGYRWDGVNRSNGYENKFFEVQNARRAHQTEAYKWSSEDM